MSGKFSKAWAKFRRNYHNPVHSVGLKQIAKQTSQYVLTPTPRRLWRMECVVMGHPFGIVVSSKRSDLAVLRFHKKFNCPIMLDRS